MSLNTQKYSVEQICEQIFKLETEHDLLDYEVGGVKIWQFLRMSIYYDIAVATGVLSAPHPRQVRRSSKARRIIVSFISLLLRNPFFIRGKIDALVVPHARKVEHEGEWIDVYSHYLIGQLEKQGQRCVLLERGGRDEMPCREPRKSLRTDALLWLNRLNTLFTKPECSAEELRRMAELDRLINETFNTSINFQSKFSARLHLFRSNSKRYKTLLKRLQPKKIYVVVAYFGWGALIKAAKDLGIEVVEIQHGVFSRYHLGYSYPGRTGGLDYFPDKLLIWGRYWSEMSELPLAQSALVEFGFEYFHRKRELFARTEKVQNQILVLSQGAVSQRLADLLLELAGQLLDYRIVYKLHPSEYATWRQQETLCRLAAMQNVTIAADGADLYRLFAESEYQFGVFSTAVFEGVGMGCKTVLLDLPGVEYMYRMIAKGLCVKCTANDDIRNILAIAGQIDTAAAAEQLFGSYQSGKMQ